MNITNEMKQILSSMVIKDYTTTLTGPPLERKKYIEINSILETLGAKWNRKLRCHVWSNPPSEVLKDYINDNTTTITTAKENKKTYQFFETPEILADELIETYSLIQPTDKILEPSGGSGNIIRSIHKFHPSNIVDCYEIQEELNKELSLLQNVNVKGLDFLASNPVSIYDKIIFNVPFAKHADIIHVQHIYKFLKDGGRMVGIMGCHSFSATHKIDIKFMEWLNTTNYMVVSIADGSFKQSGTMVSSKLIVIDKI